MPKRAKLCAVWVLACAPGCSNAPIAGFLDNCFPSKARTDLPPNPGPSVQPDDLIPAPKPKSDDKLPPPDFGPNP